MKYLKQFRWILCITVLSVLMTLPVLCMADIQTPVLKKAYADGNNIRVVWDPVDGAAGYRVYRKSIDDWKAVAVVWNTAEYLDSNISKDITYTYTVRCVNSSGSLISSYDRNGVKCCISSGSSSSSNISTPVLTGASSEGSGIRVRWNKVSGATGYRVYRKSTGNWKAIANIGNVDNYLDSGVTAGTTYTYTVRCLNMSGQLISSYDRQGVSAKYTTTTGANNLATPTLVKASTDGSKVVVQWNKVSGSAGYRVYRKTTGNWEAIKNVGDVNSYTDTNVSNGVTYTYTIRCLNKSGQLISSYDRNGISVTVSGSSKSGTLSTPVLVSASAEGSWIRVRWNAVSGAAGYRIYRKSTGNWQAIADIGSTSSYLDNGVSAGSTYTYTVRCLNKSGQLVSSYDHTGVSVTAFGSSKSGELSTPVLVGASAEGSGVRVSWNIVQGAAGYRVYRKSTGNWKAIVDIGNTNSYLDNGVASGSTYTYTVRCLDKSGQLISSYDHAGVSINYSGKTPTELPTPVLTSVTAEGTWLRVKWQAVSGATGYRIFRKTTGNWQAIDNVGNVNSYLDTNVKAGVKYTYTVRCLINSSLVSSFDRAGVTGFVPNDWIKVGKTWKYYDENGNYIKSSPLIGGHSKKDLTSLKDKNNDFIAWMDIPGTNVSHPVVHSDNVEWYLNRNFEGKSSKDGTLLSLGKCNWRNPSRNIVIYGHHVEGSGDRMFKALLKYKKESYYKEHPYIYLDSMYWNGRYKIFAVFDMLEGTIDPSKTSFASNKEFSNFVAKAKKMSYYDTGVTPGENANIITLVTCDRYYKPGVGRLIVMAVRN